MRNLIQLAVYLNIETLLIVIFEKIIYKYIIYFENCWFFLFTIVILDFEGKKLILGILLSFILHGLKYPINFGYRFLNGLH
jgi:hypothetical protein